MAVRVLGPLDVGAGLTLSPRERTLLSALIVRSPHELTAGQLADAYWGVRVPPTWPQQVKSAINRIRSQAGVGIVVTTPSGYRFGLEPDAVDAVQFERLVSDARERALHGDHARAADLYQRALALWRGTPYPDLADWEPGQFEAARLLTTRGAAEEELVEARLEMGQARSVIPDAERLVHEQPLREERWALLALADYRAGRQAEALAALHSARRHLDENLGLEPGARLATLEVAILRQDPELDAQPSSSPPSDECPYRGLQAFGPDDADVYAGREADVERVLARLRPGSLVAITGPSGTGKSSLMLAGVVPLLRTGGRTVELARADADSLRRALERVGAGGVVALDQAEELFAVLHPSEVEQVCAAAAEKLAAGASLIATVRSDFLDRAVALPLVGGAIARDVVLLGPLDTVALRAAVELPAQRAGLRVEPGLAELILHDVGTRAGALPHLSHAMVETWRRREGDTLTVSGYTDSGGIAGAIAQSAERLYAGLTVSGRQVARSLLLRLLERGADQVTVRRSVKVGPLAADPARRQVLEALVAARLVTVDGESVLVSHEALATAWPLLNAWLAEDAGDARMLRQVELAATAWVSTGRAGDELLRGPRLHAALAWVGAAPRDLTKDERAFLEASAQQERAEQQALKDRARHEKVQNRRLRWSLGAAAGLLVFAITAGAIAAVRGGEARAASEDAMIAALTSTSLALRDSDQEVAALLAVEAYRRWPNDARSRSALWGIATAAGPLIGRTRIPDAEAASAALIPGTRTAVTVRDWHSGVDTSTTWESDLAIVDIDTGEVLNRFPLPGPGAGPLQPLRGIAVSRDGGTALVQTGLQRPTGGCCMNRLDFVDLRTGAQKPGSQVLDSRTADIFELSADGRAAYLVNPVTAGLIRVDSGSGEVRYATAATPTLTENQLARFTPFTGLGNSTIATTDAGGIVVWDPESLKVVGRVPVPAKYRGTALAPDGHDGVISIGEHGLARVDLRGGTIIWRQQVDPGIRYAGAAADAATELLYAADAEGRIDEFGLDTGQPTGRRLVGARSSQGRPTITHPGRELVIVGGVTAGYAGGGTTGFIRWGLNGQGAVSRLVAPGQVAIGGLWPGRSELPVVRLSTEPETGPTQTTLWDVVRGLPGDLPGGAFQGWLGDGVLLDASLGEDNLALYDVERRQRVELADDPAFGSRVSWIADGGTGPRAYVLGVDRIVPIDPARGTVAGPVLPHPAAVGEGPRTWWRGGTSSVSESRAGDRLVVTWWESPELVSFTSVFDLTTGAELARGLDGAKRTWVTGAGEVIGFAADRITVSSLDTLEITRTLPRPGGVPQSLAVSTDGRTLLATTSDQRIWLYDLAAGIRLGGPLTSDLPGRIPAHLSPDGRSLLVNTKAGVVEWDLDPAHHAMAACRLAGRELTAAEWTTYLDGLGPRRDTCG